MFFSDTERTKIAHCVNYKIHITFGCCALLNSQKARIACVLRSTQKSLFIMCDGTWKFELFAFYKTYKKSFSGRYGIYRKRAIYVGGTEHANIMFYGTIKLARFTLCRTQNKFWFLCVTETTESVHCAFYWTRKKLFYYLLRKQKPASFAFHGTQKKFGFLFGTERTISAHFVNYGTHRAYGLCALRNAQIARIVCLLRAKNAKEACF